MFIRRRTALFSAILGFFAAIYSAAPADSFRFAILGDRTGDVQPGVFDQVCKEIRVENPTFVVGVGDSIEGLHDANAEAEWRQATEILQLFRPTPVYLAPGNHDIWSPESARLFEKFTGHPPHYSFDYATAHFTILDNSRSDELPPEELSFLEADLKAHAAQPLKIVVMHRPSWIVNVAVRNPNFPLHQLARRYGVQYVVAGHLHQMLRLELEGVTYVSMVSSGGHLRASQRYEDGWFFGHALVEVKGDNVDFRIRETGAPRGEGRVTELGDWGMTGLIRKDPAQPAAAR